MSPEQGGESQKRMSTIEFQNKLISIGQTKLSEDLTVLAEQKDEGNYNSLFLDYTEARMHEFRLRIMAEMLHREIDDLNKKIDSLSRLEIDHQQDLQQARNIIQSEIDEYEIVLESLVNEIQESEDENKDNEEFQEFKKIIEEKEAKMLEQSIVPEPDDLSKN